MLCLSRDFVYIYVKRWLAGRFRVHLREMLAGCRETAGPLQMLCLSGDFVCIYVKLRLGVGKQLDLCKCCACQGISYTST